MLQKLNIKKLFVGLLVPIFFFSFLVSCSKINKVQNSIIPKKECKKKPLKIAILPFNIKSDKVRISQFSNNQFRAEVEALLGEIEPTCPKIILVSRSDIEKAINELKFSNSGYTEDIVKIGKFLKTDLILTGDAGVDISQTTFYKKVEIDDREKNVRCQRKFLTFWFYPRMIDVEKGQIIFTKRYEVPIEKIYCENVKVGFFKNIISGGKYTEKPSENIELFIEAKKEAFDDFKDDFSNKIENF